MKKGYYRAMVALLAAPLIGSTLVSCGDNQVQSEFEKVEITNKAALQAAWSVGDAARTVEFKVTKTDGSVIEGFDVDELIADGKVLVTSSNTNVITVGNDTDLSVVAAGESTITIKVGDKTDSVVITVSAWIDSIQDEPTRVTTPVAGTYKFGCKNYELDAMHYLKGLAIPSGTYYFEGVATFKQACDLVLEEIPSATDDYKWALKVGTEYIGVEATHNSNGDHANDKAFADLTSPTTHWKWDATYETFVTYVEAPTEGENKWESKTSGDYFLGMYSKKNYTTYSMLEYTALSTESIISKSSGYFPGHLYVIPEVMDIANTDITLINGVKESEKINVIKPQGTVTFTKKSGADCVTIGADGTLTAVANGSCVITVSDTKTEIDVNVTVRDSLPGETQSNPMTAKKAVEIAAALPKGTKSTEKYYVAGTINKIEDANEGTCWLETGIDKDLELYKPVDASGVDYSADHKPEYIKGATVLAYGTLENYNNSTYEMSSGVQILDFENPTLLTLTNINENKLNLCTESEPFTVAYQNAEAVTLTVTEGDAVTVSGEVITPAKAGTAKVKVSDGTTDIIVTVNVEAVLSTDEAYAKYDALNPKAVSTKDSDAKVFVDDGKQFYVKGVVSKAPTIYNGRLSFEMKDSQEHVLTVYNLNGKTNKNDLALDDIMLGDEVVIGCGILSYAKKNQSAEICQLAYQSATGAQNFLVKVTRGQSDVTSSGDHATVTFTEGVTNDKATNGSTVKFTVAVDSGYELVSVKANGASLEPTDDVYSFVVDGTTEVVVTTKTEGEVTEKVLSMDLTRGSVNGEGGTTSFSNVTNKTGFYQSNGTANTTYDTFQILSSTVVWESASSFTLTAVLGAGSDKADLDYDVEIILLGQGGSEISATKTTVATGLAKAATTYNVTVPGANNVYGFKVTHMKEDNFNVRYYSFSLVETK